MSIEMKVAICAICGFIGLLFLALGIYSYFEYKKRKNLATTVDGRVIGLVKSGLFRNTSIGNVPGGALIGWGVAQGEQFWGGILKMRMPPWFPCVEFQIAGKCIQMIYGYGSFHNDWTIGQKVTIKLDEKNPRAIAILDDSSAKYALLKYTIAGCILFLIALIVLLIG